MIVLPNNGSRRAFFRIKRVVLFCGIILLSVFWTAGCGTLETLLQKNNSQQSLGGWIGGESANVPALSNPTEGKTVTLYFADSSGKYLIKEERTLPKTLSLARETVTQWLKGPQSKDSSIQSLVSPTTELLDIGIKDGIATVDLSKEFLNTNPKINSEIQVYALVNTLTQFSTVKEVKLRIEGKMLNNLGSLDTSHLVNMPGLIKGSVESTSVSPAASLPNQSASGSGTGITSDVAPGMSDYPSSAGSYLPDSPSMLNLFAFPSSST